MKPTALPPTAQEVEQAAAAHEQRADDARPEQHHHRQAQNLAEGEQTVLEQLQHVHRRFQAA